MPAKTQNKGKRKKARPKGMIAQSMEGWSILAKEGTKGFKWAANRIKKRD